MRGLMLVGLLIVSLIIGILIIKDMNTEDQFTHTKNIERIDKAKNAAKTATKTLNRIRQTAKEAEQRPQPAE